MNKMLASADLLRERENLPSAWSDRYSDMTPIEKSKLIDELFSLRKADQELMESERKRMESDRKRLDDLLDSFQAANVELSGFRVQLSELLKQLAAKDAENASLREELKLSRKNLYGKKSQRGCSSKKKDSVSREESKDDFDGTSGSLPCCGEEPSPSVEADSASAASPKEVRLYRLGMDYRRMGADKSVLHCSDGSRVPAGARIIKVFSRYAYEQVSELVEHEYQVVRYKMSDGHIYEAYLPASGEPEVIDMVPGTHASGNLLAYLAFNRFVLDTPLYRESYRILDEKMRVSRMTLTNWLAKGSVFVSRLVDVLKEKCLDKDAVVNCDETWCRVKVEDTYRKRYIWCLVNREAKIAIYCYEEGSRSRDALKHILGDSQVRSLQSDGYNVYMYLDDKLLDTEHLCCMAHARAKFKYALEQSDDKDAGYILGCMGELYGLEREYEQGKLSPEQIRGCRQGLKTKEIIGRLRSKLDAMLSGEHPPRGELMEKALRYLHTFWKQLFVYLNDGRYSIDNSLAERFIRPLAGERKNSLFFGSNRMAEASAAYHTIISTCRLHGISALEFLKKFFGAIVSGRRDYENLLPMTIGIKPNKI